jgi:signal transduction histidine kinase
LVIENLISNADKYSKPGVPIEISIRQSTESALELCVRDHGIGLTDSEVDEVFSPFYRSELGRSIATGMGMGLAASKRIVEAHRGTIRAETRPEGGCDFMFTLPLTADPPGQVDAG